jgi:hypothetical protein
VDGKLTARPGAGQSNQVYGYRVCAIGAAGNITTGATKTGKPSR